MPLLDNRVLDNLPARQRPACLRDAQQVLLERARWLLPKDRTLLELALRHGVPRRRIAQILNIPHSTITRRIHRILRRLARPLVLALLDERCPLPAELQQLGIEHFLQGRSTRELADVHRLSTHQVRRMLWSIRIWHGAISSRFDALRTA